MPYPGEHSARIMDPSEFERFRRQNNKLGQGIHVIFGFKAGGGSEVQAVRFDADKFTVEEAKQWLRDHDFKWILFEPSIKKEEEVGNAMTEPTSRALAVEINPTLGNMQELEGGLLVKGVKLLAAGTWTDSVQKTPCRYTPEKLKEFAANWSDITIWSRHGGGVPRDITEKIGLIRNQRFQEDAVMGDLFYHGATQRSRDTIEMVKRNLANFVSVEMRTRDQWIPGEKVYQADEIIFDGLATVNRGACSVCTIRKNEVGGSDGGKPGETPLEHPEDLEPRGERTDAPLKELTQEKEEESITMADKEKEAENSAAEARFKALEEGFTKQAKAHEDKIATMGKELEQTKAELEKMKKQPVPPATKTETPGKALEAVPEYAVKVDRKTGTVG
jgi:hypothetical protein